MEKLKCLWRIIRIIRCVLVGKYYIPFLNKIALCMVKLGIINYDFNNHIVDKIKENTQRIINIAKEGGHFDLAEDGAAQKVEADKLYM